jgi:AcrR family transcriptional regulator
MIDAAERLASERGLGAMSLRDVMAAAGQRNKSAAQYHFGSREGLVEAVIEARMAPVNARRLELLHALGSPLAVRDVADVLVRPLAEAVVGERESRWARFLLQSWSDPSVQDVVRRNFAGSSYRQVRAVLSELGVPSRRVDQAVGLLVLTLAGWEAGRRPALSRGALVDDLVDVCTAVLTTEERA